MSRSREHGDRVERAARDRGAALDRPSPEETAMIHPGAGSFHSFTVGVSPDTDATSSEKEATS